MNIDIRTIFQACIVFDGTSVEAEEAIGAFALEFESEGGVEVLYFEGCASAGPDITIMSEKREAVERISNKIVGFILEQGGSVI